jgi:hypothetical protein
MCIRWEHLLFEYFEELYNIGMSDIQNHDFILQIPTILYLWAFEMIKGVKQHYITI